MSSVSARLAQLASLLYVENGRVIIGYPLHGPGGYSYTHSPRVAAENYLRVKSTYTVVTRRDGKIVNRRTEEIYTSERYHAEFMIRAWGGGINRPHGSGPMHYTFTLIPNYVVVTP